SSLVGQRSAPGLRSVLITLFSMSTRFPGRSARGPRARLDDRVLAEGGDLLGGVPKLAQDLVGVLAVRGGGAANRARRARERRREPLDQHLPALRMSHGLGHAQVPDLL